jgi:hypothetical protein
VPKGRGPFPTWEAGAYDALVTLKGLDKIKDWPIERVIYECERYNGFGYRTRGKPSAYLWSFSNIYEGGKFIKDGPEGWSPTTWDQQCGTMPLLKHMMALDASISFATKPIDGEVIDPKDPDPIRPGGPIPEPTMDLAKIIGVVLLFMERYKMAIGTPDLLKLIQDPTLQKLVTGKAVTLDELRGIPRELLSMLLGQSAPALPAPDEPVTGRPTPLPVEPEPPAPTKPPLATTPSWLINLSGAATAIIAGLGLGSADVITTPVGPSSGTVGQLWPLVSAAAGALGVYAPIVRGIVGLFSRVKIT